ncbi:MAG TPA: hypothetical protein PKM50_03635 [Methanoregula sp.]|nr:hypothetical protein [Methanoregula sp.]
MVKTTRARTGTRSSKAFGEQKRRGKYVDPLDEENQEDPCRDVRDIYEDQPDSQDDEYIWPVNENDEDD